MKQIERVCPFIDSLSDTLRIDGRMVPEVSGILGIEEPDRLSNKGLVSSIDFSGPQSGSMILVTSVESGLEIIGNIKGSPIERIDELLDEACALLKRIASNALGTSYTLAEPTALIGRQELTKSRRKGSWYVIPIELSEYDGIECLLYFEQVTFDKAS